MLLNARQIDSASLNLAIQQASSGAAFSGNFVAYVGASGFIGPVAVWTTGGAQIVSGVKTFTDSPLVPYSGSSGSAPSARWVNDQIGAYSGWANNTYTSGQDIVSSSGQLATNLALTGSGLYATLTGLSGQAVTDYATKAALFLTGAALSKVRVTGSSTIQDAHFSGYGGTQVIVSGGIILISGGAGGGGGAGNSNVLVTGSSTIASANLTGAGIVTLTYDGTYVIVSGAASTAGTPNTVTTTGTYVLAGTYTFSGSPFVPIPTQPSGAVNILFLSGASGVLSTRDSTISGVLYGQMTGISGSIIAGSTFSNTYYITGTGVVAAYSSGTVSNTFNITSGNASVNSSGTVTNTFNGPVSNVYSLSGVTGNFVNMAFYFDSNNLATGLNNLEAMVGRTFFFTGYGLGVINSGTQGFFSGSLYQRTQTNTKTNFIDFSLNSGVVFKASGGFNQTITGLNRVGLDIFLIGTGITGLSVGVFGVGY